LGGKFGQRAFAAAYNAVRSLLSDGVSVVIDQAWRKGLSDAELLPLVAISRAVALHVSTSPETAIRRVVSRGHRPGLASVDEIVAAMSAEWDEFGPLDLAIPDPYG